MFTTVFEIGESTIASTVFSFSALGFELLAVALVLVGSIFTSIKMRRRQPLFAAVPVLLFFVMAAPSSLSNFRRGQRLFELYKSGSCSMVEGVVHVEARQRPEGHSVDRITVAGIPLEVSHFERGPHYRDSLAYGGVLDEGVVARVWYCPPGTMFQASRTGPIVRVDLKK